MPLGLLLAGMMLQPPPGAAAGESPGQAPPSAAQVKGGITPALTTGLSPSGPVPNASLSAPRDLHPTERALERRSDPSSPRKDPATGEEALPQRATAPSGEKPGAPGLASETAPAPKVEASGGVPLPTPLPAVFQSMLLLDDLAHARVLTATPDTRNLPPEVKQALYDALDFRVDLDTEAGFFTLLSLRWSGTWALATVTAVDVTRPHDTPGETHITPDDLMSLLVVSTPQGWEAALEDDPYIQALLSWIPPRELSEEARSVLFPNTGQAIPQKRSPGGRALQRPAWQENRDAGARPGPKNASGEPAAPAPLQRIRLEVPTILPDQQDVLAPGNGTLTYLCNDGTQAALVLNSSDAPIQWLLGPLAAHSLESLTIAAGMTVVEGQRLADAAPRILHPSGRAEEGIESTCGQLGAVLSPVSEELPRRTAPPSSAGTSVEARPSIALPDTSGTESAPR